MARNVEKTYCLWFIKQKVLSSKFYCYYGEVESEISVVNFTMIWWFGQWELLLLKLMTMVRSKPVDPIKQDYQFIKWTVDNNLESGAINFETRTYTKTTMIYAMFYVRPAQVVSGSLVYTQDTDEITWDPVTGVDSYKVKWNGATKYITVTTPKIKANVSLTGDYDIEITVKNVPEGYIESTLIRPRTPSLIKFGNRL